jgi:hypothetical protein
MPTYESELSAEVDAKTPLPAPVDVTPTNTASGADVAWDLPDNSPDGIVTIERSDDGGDTFSVITTGLSPSTESYSDSNVPAGEPVFYRIVRSTDHATSRTVQELLGAELTVSIVETNSPVEAGESLGVTVDISNQGGRGTEAVSLTVEEQ